MFVFLIRQFPDLDHIVPIAHALAERHPGCVRVLKQSPYFDIAGDYRIEFLEREHGIVVDHIYSLGTRHPFRHLFGRFLVALARNIPIPLIQPSLKALMKIIFNDTWADAALDDLRPKVLAYDYCPLQKYTQLKVLTRRAQSRNIPVVLLPHGADVLIHKNRPPVHKQDVDHKIINRPNIETAYSNPDKPNESLTPLGSSRYNERWNKLNIDLVLAAYPAEDLPNHQGRIKVLVCNRPAVGFYGDDPLLAKLQGLENIDLVIKGKPRSNTGMKNIHSVGEKYPTSRLIQWADIVIIAGSSIAVEVLLSDKPLLYLKYLSPNDIFVFANHGACWTINSEHELFDALSKLVQGDNQLPYNKSEVDAFIKEVVYAQKEIHDVLKNYANFFIQISCKSDVPQAQGPQIEEDT